MAGAAPDAVQPAASLTGALFRRVCMAAPLRILMLEDNPDDDAGDGARLPGCCAGGRSQCGHLSSAPPGSGLDARSGQIVDMVEAGIVDSVAAVRSAVHRRSRATTAHRRRTDPPPQTSDCGGAVVEAALIEQCPCDSRHPVDGPIQARPEQSTLRPSQP